MFQLWQMFLTCKEMDSDVGGLVLAKLSYLLGRHCEHSLHYCATCL